MTRGPSLDTPIEYLKGVGPERGSVLQKELKVFTVEDLLFHFPIRYIDRSKVYKVAHLSADMPFIQVVGQITQKRMIGEGRSKRLIAHLSDGSGLLELVWFQKAEALNKFLKTNVKYLVFGKPNYFNGDLNVVHPEIETISDQPKILVGIQPVYSSTDKMKRKGLDSKGIRKLQQQIRQSLSTPISEILPHDMLQELKLTPRYEAFQNIHFPADYQAMNAAKRRLKFEELFLMQLEILFQQKTRNTTFKGQLLNKVGKNTHHFYDKVLPFELTNAQKRVIKEIRADLCSGYQMNRLLQGDVGSGKTVVALMIVLLALDNDKQSCLMAPTEILANQHYQGLKELLGGMPIKLGLLTGSIKGKKRRVLLEALEKGEIDLLIGTHALIEDHVKFEKLGLVIIDEQHRFGVAQRAKLWKKSKIPPHVLVMTATPIPRTLAMTVYGDLETSAIDELPPGRKPIITKHFFESSRLKVMGFLKQQLDQGAQIYVVYPLIEESEKMDYHNLMEGYESMSRHFPIKDYPISIVHGKMKPAIKEEEMQKFVRGETKIMVATTVIEVGINVPNASIMVLESAEKFGLSQLHQLRGRVGRGNKQSYCLLMTGYKLSADGKERMKIMTDTNDGYKIAEADLKLRGPGDMAGTQQSGLPELKIADLVQDQRILQAARNVAKKCLENDPELLKKQHHALAKLIKEQHQNQINWRLIS